MRLCELTDVQLRRVFDCHYKQHVKNLVCKVAESGIWHDNFWMAYEALPPSLAECDDLLDEVLSHYPESKLDLENLERDISKSFCDIFSYNGGWKTLADGSYILNEGTRLAKFQGNNMIWESSRISLDGIKIESADLKTISGFAWWGSEEYKLDEPFILNCDNGDVLKGKKWIE